MPTRKNRPPKQYSVGYGKPPLHTRFQPGQSGNPAGRRKGFRNLSTDVKRMLQMPVKVKEASRTRQRSTQESALLVLREKALRGDARALDRLLGLAQHLNNEAVDPGAAPAPSAEDQAILDAYVAERMSAPLPSPSTPAREDEGGGPPIHTEVVGNE